MSLTATRPMPTESAYHGGDSARFDQEVVELQLLLPRWQAAALDAAARERGMTSGQILRRVIADLFSESAKGADGS